MTERPSTPPPQTAPSNPGVLPRSPLTPEQVKNIVCPDPYRLFYQPPDQKLRRSTASKPKPSAPNENPKPATTPTPPPPSNAPPAASTPTTSPPAKNAPTPPPQPASLPPCEMLEVPHRPRSPAASARWTKSSPRGTSPSSSSMTSVR